MSSLSSRSTYQPQLRQQHLYNSTISKQHVLARYWIESILGHRLPSNDLYLCLRDGFYLCKILQIIQSEGNDSTVDYHDNYQLPDDRIHHFLRSAQEFGLQSSDLFSVNDLMNGENMNAVISTILILAHTYSCKRFAGKSNNTPLPKRSQSYSFQLDQIQQQPNIVRSKSETLLSNNIKRMNEHNTKTGDSNHEQGPKEKKEYYNKEERYTERRKEIVAPIITTTNNHSSLVNHYIHKALPNSPRNSTTNKWDPPFDIQRPNCIPGYGPFSLANFKDEDEEGNGEEECMLSSSPPSPIDSFDEEDIYNTKKSNTPSSSGDSGYGTTTARKSNNNNNNKKVQDLFEALFAPIAPPSTAQPPPSLKIQPNNNTVSHSGGGNSKLSSLFSKKNNDQPHYVKFQTWSNNQQQQKPNTTVTNSSTPIRKGKQQHDGENDGSIRRPHEEYLFKSTNHKRSSSSYNYNRKSTASEEWCEYLEQEQQTQLLLPPIIKVGKKEEIVVEQQQPLLRKQTRSRRRTDASLVRIVSSESILSSSAAATPKHARRKSIGSTLDIKSPTTPNNMSFPIGTSNILEHCDEDGNLIARYKLGNVIGKGHFGTVYRALDLMSGKTVAIKQISLKDSRKSDIEDMMQEAALLSSLTHTNIVKYEGFIQTHEHMNIVLEFVENGSLLNTLKSFGNSLPEHLVASYCHHILQGLAYLHKQDVVHCDLKAANILTTKAGDVKLSDFGVSLNLKLKNHEDNLVSGTPFWMSPEVIELKGASVQSDIWSLGCTVIELCTGKPPYADLITMTAMFKIVEDDCPPLPTDISDDLHNFLKLCFKKNPIERPTAEHLLHHPWITSNNSTTPIMSPITPVTKSNNIILNNYLQNMTKKDDMITLNNTNTRSQPIPRGSNSMKVMSPSSAPYYSPNSNTLPAPPPLPPHLLSPNTQRQYDLPTFQSKSLFANKFNQRQHEADSMLARQSMPIVANQYQQKPKQQDNTIPSPHVHNLIECSFPKGAGQCKVCNNHIKHDALVCKDFCGYICHKQCKSINNNSSGGRRRASDQRASTSPLPSTTTGGGGPKPMPSVSSQLREKFSFSRILLSSKPHQQQQELGDILEDHNITVSPALKSKSSSWWKKKQ